ncbi:MAG: hypothetical protein HC828_20550, partial [Blastochloris sp.]|nr:hypothetical protein [Blastochloris sp.]
MVRQRPDERSDQSGAKPFAAGRGGVVGVIVAILGAGLAALIAAVIAGRVHEDTPLLVAAAAIGALAIRSGSAGYIYRDF